MQTKQELEDWYDSPDRWGYFSNPEDFKRRDFILGLLEDEQLYKRALDIGCGEGFITEKLPAAEIYGLDLSDNAMSRLPQIVKAVTTPEGKFDLVISTGTLYPQYDHKAIYDMIMKCSSKHILISGIAEWLIDYDFGEPIKTINFNYREYTQRTTLYKIR